MNWSNVSLAVLGLSAFFGAFLVALWVSLVIWTFRDMRSRSRDAFAQLLAALMVLVLGPFGVVLYFILRPRETLAEKYERSLEEEALLQDIEERRICPGCKQPIESDFMICPICNTRLRQSCLHCGRLIHPRWSLCPYCAQSQKPVPGAAQAGRVTLMDLEHEEELLGAGAGAFGLPDRELESIAELEAEAMRNLSETGYGAPSDLAWDQPVEAPAEGVADVDLYLSSDKVLDLSSADVETEEQAETEPAEETPAQRIRSLLKRP